MKGISRLSYTSTREGLAEKFDMSEALLAALNPGQHFDRAGASISSITLGELHDGAEKSALTCKLAVTPAAKG